ncbi:MAG: YjjG family noncanonical pyrimidine nucleotidase [Bacteroidales bacterium]|nr:YjjG family noncanonical pyrimidine nucleotidase [Bacteroidales bacterium]MBN2819185.1 YjjG family noncanonical pyrimidine nucleotidase [Bacteroidales bacterium]
MRKYKHLFFDLDRTLWDFDHNTSVTLQELLSAFSELSEIKDSLGFIKNYHRFNDYVWNLYREKKITKTVLRKERFRMLLQEYNMNNESLVAQIEAFYLNNAPYKSKLINNASEVLNKVKDYYSLYIVSNGFYDVQLTKLRSGGIDKFFKKIFTSDRIGYAKPNKAFFEYCIKSANAKKTESLFIGDDLTNDIMGPASFGIDQVWFNPNNQPASFKPSFEIKNLIQLTEIL